MSALPQQENAPQLPKTAEECRAKIAEFVKNNKRYKKEYSEFKKLADQASELMHDPRADLIIKSSAEVTYKRASTQADSFGALMVPGVPDSVNQWKRKELTTLATSFQGVETFEALAKLFDLAYQMDPKTGKSTAEASRAQAVFKSYATVNGKLDNDRLVELLQDVKYVAGATLSKRAKLLEERGINVKPAVQAKVGAVFDLPQGITIDPTDNKQFDQQTALAILGERGVKVDSDQSHKTPNFEQEALKAVASLKNTVITRAA